MNKSIAQIKLELHKATGGPVLPIGPPADVAAKLAALKEQMRQQGTDFNRRMQGVVNAEKTAGTGTVLPTDKASGGLAHLAIGGQGPKNWMKGKVEDVVKPLRQNLISGTDPAEALKQMQDQYSPEEMQKLSENARASVDRSFESLHRMNAMNQWVDRNLTNYIKKQMATHDDPIRKLAEQGITHLPNERFVENQAAGAHRVRHNAPRLGQSDEAKSWEDRSDLAMDTTNVGKVLGDEGMAHVYGEPWMQKADPETKLFKKGALMNSQMLGFDHLVDVLKQDLASGRIRPDQLSKVSIEHAVRRAHEYDQERKKAMAETALKATEGMPVHKEYPEGYKWIELALNPELPEGHSMTPAGTYIDPQGNESIHHPNYAKLDDALKYEGDTMGHCVGGYTPDVVAGKSRIFSLRDAKNEPHVTVEVKPNQHLDYNDWFKKQPEEIQNKIAQRRVEDKNHNIYEGPEYLADRAKQPPAIKQIKGKGNAKPKKDYIPYVQDFVKNGNWSHVDDLHNTDLQHSDKMPERKRFEEAGMQVPKYVSENDRDNLIHEYHNRTSSPVDPDFMAKTYGIPKKAEGGTMNTPDLAQSRFRTNQQSNPALMDNIGIDEALDMSPKSFVTPDPKTGGGLPVGGVDKVGGLPIGGVDQSPAPGMQFAPQAPQQPQQDASAPQGGQPPSAGPSSPGQQPPSNILSLTPQGRALGAMAPQGMATGGSAKQRADIRFKLDKLAHMSDGGVPPVSLSQFPNAVSTRTPSAVKATEDPINQNLLSDYDTYQRDPEAFKHNADLINQYPNSKTKAKHPKVITEDFVEHAKDNLLHLHDAVPPETRKRSQLWYDGARNIVDRWGKEYGVPDQAAAGVLAVLSPQKDWFMNVSLGKRVIDTLKNEQNYRWDKNMGRVAEEIFNKPQYAQLVKAIQNKRLDQLTDPVEKAAWIRVFDQAHNPRSHDVVSPEGNPMGVRLTDKGEPYKTGWGSLNEIAKAVNIYENPTRENISKNLGGQHKVRNFYNNIYYPNNPDPHTTIDTHAVAAALMRPLSGNSREVAHNFGSNVLGEVGPKNSSVSGMQGTYGAYHEAYKRAAKERGILPRQMQSITWEAVRGLFPDTFKSSKTNVNQVDKIWNDYKSKKISLDKARELTHELSGGINEPEWKR